MFREGRHQRKPQESDRSEGTVRPNLNINPRSHPSPGLGDLLPGRERPRPDAISRAAPGLRASLRGAHARHPGAGLLRRPPGSVIVGDEVSARGFI